MYVSEYYYGATPDYWMLPGIDENGLWNSDHTVENDYSKAYNDNWMSTGLIEWTLSRISEVPDYFSNDFVYAFAAFGVSDYGDVGGCVSGGGVNQSDGFAVRPSFNLSSSIKFTSGEGTAVNPIRINL